MGRVERHKGRYVKAEVKKGDKGIREDWKGIKKKNEKVEGRRKERTRKRERHDTRRIEKMHGTKKKKKGERKKNILRLPQARKKRERKRRVKI